MTIEIDSTTIGTQPDGYKLFYVVVRCSECPYWFAVRDSKRAALTAATDHEDRVHPGAHDARRRRDRA